MLETERLILRPWQASDYPAFIAMGQNPEVMRYFPSLLTPEQSLQFIEKVTKQIDQYGWGLWAVELKETKEFIGFIGLQPQPDLFEFTPCVEIGWRLAKKYWHRGYATEGARAVLDYAFNTLGLNKVVSFTATVNTPSEAVMKKIGMVKTQEFQHPRLPKDHPLCWHVLYEINQSNYSSK
ncbi:GNAT family N-acetyltransferase [Acinetobacter sp. YWS30-1]|uniref:GNAT family N-acetyltransferase n=1 Tax=unclassified Acinetobacter TaxID=196816 RepID=UPI0015D240DE|nr:MULTISPECIES: GNAT family N-acetyltransferase [unclassified Acinetobacter]WPC36018.1 GNAT family N-acetyltransferase [Acinetobacter sp. YWS30-1]